MLPIHLKKSLKALTDGFKEFGDLPIPQRPIGFSQDTLHLDLERICNEFNGKIKNNKGQEVFVITDTHPKMPRLLLIEFFDANSCKTLANKKLGCINLLIVPEEGVLDVGNFSLSDLQGSGIGKTITERFRHYIPNGIKISFTIEEFLTRQWLLDLMVGLMEEGEIVDWRISSQGRPKPTRGKIHFLPPKDCKRVEEKVLHHYQNIKSPLLGLFRAFRASFQKLSIGLDDQCRFIFEVEGECQSLLF